MLTYAMNANSAANESVRVRPSANARRPIATLAADAPIGRVVVVQEDLLQRRLAARERDERQARQLRQQRSQLAADLEPQRALPRARDAHARQLGQPRRRAVERHLDGVRAEVAQLLQRPLVDQPPVAQDPDAVADRLDLAEDVRGEEDRLPALLRLAHGLAEG